MLLLLQYLTWIVWLLCGSMQAAAEHMDGCRRRAVLMLAHGRCPPPPSLRLLLAAAAVDAEPPRRRRMDHPAASTHRRHCCFSVCACCLLLQTDYCQARGGRPHHRRPCGRRRRAAAQIISRGSSASCYRHGGVSGPAAILGRLLAAPRQHRLCRVPPHATSAEIIPPHTKTAKNLHRCCQPWQSLPLAAWRHCG